MSTAYKKILVPKLRRAFKVEYIAANFVSSGNHDDWVQELRKLTSTTNTTGDSPPPAKKAKKPSNNQADNSTDSAMIASNFNTSRPTKPKQRDVSPPQKCKHCGKFVIHTDGICDVYNVPSVHMASSGICDTQNMSVIFNITDFQDHKYMFANDLGIIDDLTLDKYLRLVSPQIITSTNYELSDAESPQIPIPPSPIPLLDTGYISPDSVDVRECTRQ
jgi:hypothetical protein